MTYSTIHTTYGLSRMAAAESSGASINLTHMAVGDGNGNPTEPSITQTTLVRERYRAPVNRVYSNADNPNQYIAELIVPKSAGGFTLREIAVFDDTGGMFVVGNLPDAYMPGESEGAFSDAVIRCIFEVSNADVVTLMVDPTVAVASQAWVVNNLTPATLIPGGTTGQFLSKESNADGDYKWTDATDITVTVDLLEEVQTLADKQTTVDWQTVTNDGLAVYIDGIRLRRGSGVDEWQPNPADDYVSILLGKSYPAGTKIVGAQNDPAGSAVKPLERAKNLSDVPEKSVARANLGVHSVDESNAAGQPGDIKYTARSTAPPGWLKANGALVSRSAYPALFAAIGTRFGAGDGETTFKLPDLRGEFIRGWDDGRGVDGGREIGELQLGSLQSHGHTANTSAAGNHSHTGSATSAGSHSHGASSGGQSQNHSHNVSGGTSHANLVGDFWVGGSNGGVGGIVRHISNGGRPGLDNNSGFQQLYRVDASHSHSFNVNSGGASNDHNHSISVGQAGEHGHALNINGAGAHSHDVSVNATGGSETRPRNVALLACIKF